LDSQQDELGEILFYLVKGLLSMRRYTELRQQLDRWGFLFHNSVRGEGSFDRTGGGISVSGTSSSPSQRPSPAWIPWRLHVVAAAALLYNCSSPPQSLTTSSTDTNPSPSLDAADVLWRIRDAIPPDDISNRILAERVLSNVMIRTKQWRMAVGCLQRILDLIPSSLRDQGGQRRWRQQQQPLQAESIQLLEACYQVEVLSCQGRILLQMGALPEASRVFQHAQATWDDEAASSTKSSLSSAPTSEDWGSASALAVTVVQRSSAQLTVNQALLSFASCQYDRALELFRRAAAQIRQAEPLPGQNPASRRRRDAGGFDSSEDAFLLLGTDDPLSSLFSETCNNMALCAVYTCRLNEAIHLMESLVRQDPTRYLTDRVALNLWYVLCSSWLRGPLAGTCPLSYLPAPTVLTICPLVIMHLQT
jgi:tetratricopeptide (TPR) repeat protein